MLKHPILIALGLSFIGSMTGCSDCTVNASGLCVPNEQAAATTTDGGTDGGTVVGSADGGTADGGSSGGTGVGGFAEFGTTPNGAHLSLDCSPFNVPAFTNTDCLYSHWDGDVGDGPGVVNCTLKMADRNGLVIGTATPVSFESEAGAISPTATSPEFDPAKAITDQETLGHAVGYLEVFGSPLPPDVTPFTGEPSIVNDYGCGSRTANPRDGYVTVIAWVRGEEGFVDVNHNGKYDLGEPFVDVGEPYVDANDNGKWDPGEWFLDVNGDAQYTGPNGKWDADTILWTQTRVLYSGAPAYLENAGNLYLSRFFTTGAPPSPTPWPTEFVVYAPKPATNTTPAVPGTSVTYPFFLTDDRLNPMTSSAKFAATAAAGHVDASLSGPYATSNLLGHSFRMLYCDKPDGSGTCLDGPAEYACQTAPCYVVPEVGLCRTAACTGLITGNPGSVTITGVSVGPDTVYVSTTIDGVRYDAVPWVNGVCLAAQ